MRFLKGLSLALIIKARQFKFIFFNFASFGNEVLLRKKFASPHLIMSAKLLALAKPYNVVAGLIAKLATIDDRREFLEELPKLGAEYLHLSSSIMEDSIAWKIDAQWTLACALVNISEAALDAKKEATKDLRAIKEIEEAKRWVAIAIKNKLLEDDPTADDEERLGGVKYDHAMACLDLEDIKKARQDKLDRLKALQDVFKKGTREEFLREVGDLKISGDFFFDDDDCSWAFEDSEEWRFNTTKQLAAYKILFSDKLKVQAAEERAETAWGTVKTVEELFNAAQQEWKAKKEALNEELRLAKATAEILEIAAVAETGRLVDAIAAFDGSGGQ